MITPEKKQPVARKPYAPPKLVKYGEVRALTQTSTMGSAEGAGMTTSLMSPSQRALKENVVRVGEHPLGIGLYIFDYKACFRDRFGHGRQFGVMAEEVEAVLPQAVSLHPSGHKVVDYAMLSIRRDGSQLSG